MSLLILLLYSFWDLEGVSGARANKNTGGIVRSDVTKLTSIGESPSTSISSKISKRDLSSSWDLVVSSSDLISVHPNNTNGTSEDMLGIIPKELRGHAAATSHPISSHLNVQMRLRKLEYYFSSLRIWEEDCRLRLLCEVAKDPAKFSPLAVAFLDETRFIGDEKSLARRLLNSEPGAKLLTYIEATIRGNKRNACDVYVYRCPQSVFSMINYQTLLLWREMSKWLTVKFVSRGRI